MKLVYLESPYAGQDAEAIARNVRYARACMLDCLRRGEAPFVSHLLYTKCLQDSIPEDRKLGMEAGFAWGEASAATVVYVDLGISPGMKVGMQRAADACREIILRNLPGWIA